MLKATEAHQISVDINKQARILSKEALEVLEEDLDKKIKEAAKRGDYQCAISLQPIYRLNEINIEAAKTTVHLLNALLEFHGYSHSGITNTGHCTLEIFWTLS
jgi:uncharacterized protein YicC (UPF0701 family)